MVIERDSVHLHKAELDNEKK